MLMLLVGSLLGWTQTPIFLDASRKEKLKALAPKVDALFAKYKADRQIPALVYGYVVDGEIVHQRAWGTDDDTVFRIASMTKSFTALAILKLRDEGKLSLDDPASKYVPELAKIPLPTKDSPAITVRHLLTHGAGFPEDNPWGDRQLDVADAKLGEWLKAGVPFSTPPGTAYEYSNYGFALLGRIVAAVSGVSYEAYLEREILQPLGLKSATLEGAKIPAGKRATGYGRRDGKLFEIPGLAHGAFGAMGGLWINGRDLGQYVAYHLSAEPARDDADPGPVRRASLREMQTGWRPSFFNGKQAGDYGYGLSVSRNCSFKRIVAHGGGLPGFGSYMMWLPEYGVGFYAMANLTYSGPSAPMREALELMKAEGALRPREWPLTPALAATQKGLVEWWQTGKAEVLDALAADNLYQDVPREDFARRLTELKRKYASCRLEGKFAAENWLRGVFGLSCQGGYVEVDFTLAPTQPPKVQFLRLRGLQQAPKPDPVCQP
jgi:CubicO group peptidase (beta-lactamase class C family)